jgi:tetratricopeptide (TPR) repeat protein
MVAHVEELISEAVKAGIGQPTSRLAGMLGLFLKEKSLWPEAELFARLALEIDEQTLEPDHPNVAIRLNNLAQLLQDTNRLSEAEPLMRRALEIDEKSYGPAHPEVATDLNNLAQLLKATNRLSEAEPLMWRALEIDEQIYGPAHPEVATALNNLARLLQATNRLSEVEGMLGRCVIIHLIFSRLTGHLHPNLRAAFGNYLGLAAKMSLSEDEIGERIWAFGIEAGFDRDGYRRVLEQVFQ